VAEDIVEGEAVKAKVEDEVAEGGGEALKAAAVAGKPFVYPLLTGVYFCLQAD
jgi:hypothetical protein